MPVRGRFPRRRGRHSHERLSELLDRLAHEDDSERIAFGDLLEAVGERAFGALILVFSILAVMVGVIPGISTLLGLPLLLLSIQLAIGSPRPWLPRSVSARSLERSTFARVVTTIRPRLRQFEKLLKPRLLVLTSAWAERGIGLCCLIAAILVFLPIPFGNLLPAVALCAFGVALMERDGVLVLLGLGTLGFSLIVLGGAALALKALALDGLPKLLHLT